MLAVPMPTAVVLRRPTFTQIGFQMVPLDKVMVSIAREVPASTSVPLAPCHAELITRDEAQRLPVTRLLHPSYT
jgi:hypothetical protein